MQVVREDRLNAEIHGSKSEAEQSAKEMNDAHVGFLEVGHHTDSEAGEEANP